MEQHSQAPGIITVVDQNEEQEDEALAALRDLPKFEPLVVPELASHFTLATVFGSLAISSDSKQATSERAFNPNVLVDIFVQMNAHSKKCAQDIQEYQRSLGVKMRILDDYTTGAVQELSNIHQQVKTHSDHLLSVHAISKQAQITTTLLHGIVEKLAVISEQLPPEYQGERKPSPDYLPNLYRYLQQEPVSHSGQGQTSSQGSGSGSVPSSSLALLGPGATSASSRRTNQPRQNPPRQTAALSIPKARASMALVSSALTYLTMGSSSEMDQGQSSTSLDPMYRNTATTTEGLSSSMAEARTRTTSPGSSAGHTSLAQQLRLQQQQQQQPSMRASAYLKGLSRDGIH